MLFAFIILSAAVAGYSRYAWHLPEIGVLQNDEIQSWVSKQMKHPVVIEEDECRMARLETQSISRQISTSIHKIVVERHHPSSTRHTIGIDLIASVRAREQSLPSYLSVSGLDLEHLHDAMQTARLSISSDQRPRF